MTPLSHTTRPRPHWPGSPVLALLGVGLSLAGPPALRAQDSSRAIIQGRVVDSTGTPIPGASLLVLGTEARATSDAGGGFFLSVSGGRSYIVQVRAVGWKPLAFVMEVVPGQDWDGLVGLEPAPVVLPELAVEAPAGKPTRYRNTTRFDDFYRRRRLGFGRYFTREQIDQAIAAGAYKISHLIERMAIPGVRADRSLVTFARCSGYGAKVGVWIDGARIPNGGARMPDFDLNVRDIEAMEVYRSVAQIPGPFLEDSCAAIVIWTKYN